MREKLILIHNRLDEPIGPQLEDFHRGPAALSKIDGVGGLQFQAQAPPGVGRLIRLPFYLTGSPTFGTSPKVTNATIGTDGGTNVPAVANPVVLISSFGTSIGGLVMATPVLEWALLRIVGFQASAKSSPAEFGVFPRNGWGVRPFLVASQLQVGGGANLFPQEGYVDAAIYTPFVPEFAGLRSYPLIRSPNNATVRLGFLGQPGLPIIGPPPPRRTWQSTFSANLVCEILEDKDFGSHIPGPYARINATARDQYPDGTSFVDQ